MSKKILCFVFSVIFIFSFHINTLASTINEPDKKIKVNMVIDGIEYPSFDINDYPEYKSILLQRGIDIDSVIGIYPINQDSTSTEERKVSIPGGFLTLTGTYLSPTQWRLTILNIGVLNMNDIEADVKLVNYAYGLTMRSVNYLGGLNRFVSTRRTYISNGYPADCAIVTVTGCTSQGEYFNMGGTDYR